MHRMNDNTRHRNLGTHVKIPEFGILQNTAVRYAEWSYIEFRGGRVVNNGGVYGQTQQTGAAGGLRYHASMAERT